MKSTLSRWNTADRRKRPLKEEIEGDKEKKEVYVKLEEIESDKAKSRASLILVGLGFLSEKHKL